MPLVRITCPNCRSGMQIDRPLPTQITCPSCRNRFVAEAPAKPAGPPPLPVQAARPARPAVPPPPQVRAARPADADAWCAEQTTARPAETPQPAVKAESQPVRWGLVAAAAGGGAAVLAVAVVLIVLALPARKPANVAVNDGRQTRN